MLKAKIVELRSHLHSAAEELARIDADDAHALAMDNTGISASITRKGIEPIPQ